MYTDSFDKTFYVRFLLVIPETDEAVRLLRLGPLGAQTRPYLLPSKAEYCLWDVLDYPESQTGHELKLLRLHIPEPA